MPVVDPESIPDAATRVRIKRGTETYLDAASAREALERYPDLREQEITADCGPVPLHMEKGPGLSVRWTAWSDGQILKGRVAPRPGALPGRLAAVSKLMRDVNRAAYHASRGHQVPAQTWLRWLDASESASEQVARTVDERAVGPDRIATRILDLTRHTVRCADGTDDRVWVLRESVQVPEERGHPPVREFRPFALESTTRILHTETDALAAFADRDDHRPPVVTVADAATALGTTPAALRQAISRAHRKDEWRPYSFSEGRTNWYVMDDITRMWNARPGHGPGRGHTYTARDDS